jgi:hypothetical protein
METVSLLVFWVETRQLSALMKFTQTRLMPSCLEPICSTTVATGERPCDAVRRIGRDVLDVDIGEDAVELLHDLATNHRVFGLRTDAALAANFCISRAALTMGLFPLPIPMFLESVTPVLPSAEEPLSSDRLGMTKRDYDATAVGFERFARAA